MIDQTILPSIFFFMRSYADHFKHFFLSGVIEKNSNGKGQQK